MQSILKPEIVMEDRAPSPLASSIHTLDPFQLPQQHARSNSKRWSRREPMILQSPIIELSSVSPKPITFDDGSSFLSDETVPPRSYGRANIFSRWTFSWIDGLIRRGAESLPLEVNECPEIDENFTTKKLGDKLHQNWEKERRAKSTPRLYRAVANTFIVDHLYIAFLGLLNSSVKILGGILLGQLVRYFTSSSVADDSSSGYLLATYLCLTVLFQAFFHHQMFFHAMNLGLKLRVSCLALLYAKVQSLSISNKISEGCLMNLVSNDVQRFDDACTFGHFSYLAPIELCLAGIFIAKEIGWAGTAAGLGLILALIPIQTLFAKRFTNIRIKTVKYRDQRIKVLGDMLAGILNVKCQVLEKYFIGKVNLYRNKEVHCLLSAAVMKAANEAFFFASPALVSLACFGTVYAVGGVLTPDNVFATIALLNVVRLTSTNWFPRALETISEATVSLSRIEAFLLQKDAEVPLSSDLSSEIVLELKNVTFQWTLSNSRDSLPFALEHLNFKLHHSECLALVGEMASGKSTFLLGLLGELTGSGSIQSNSRLSYASTVPWLTQGTIRDNILMGRVMQPILFYRILQATCLEDDLLQWENGLDTLVGERGVALSGGQKARLSLARTLYDPFVKAVLLDNVLAALDSRVAVTVFERVNQLLKREKIAVIWVLQSNELISQCDRVIYLQDRTISCSRPHENLEKHESVANVPCPTATIGSHRTKKWRQKNVGTVRSPPQEDQEQGAVKGSTYTRFASTGSPYFTVFLVILCLVSQSALILSDQWLSLWSSQSESEQRSIIYIQVLAALAGSVFFLSILRAYGFFYWSIKASAALFQNMLQSVTYSPMHWFETTPLGRLMNRFAKDQTLVDEVLPWTFYDAMQFTLLVMGSTVAVCVVMPWMGLVLLPVLLVFYYMRKFYLKCSRQIKRLEAVTRSPVLSLFNETLSGRVIIRCTRGLDAHFMDMFYQRQDENTKLYFSFIGTSRWMAFRLDLVTVLFFAIASVLGVWMGTSLGNLGGAMFFGSTQGTAASIGFSLTNILQLIGLVQWCTRQWAEVENLMTSVERCFSWTLLPDSEWDEGNELQKQATELKENSTLTFESLSITYPGNDVPTLYPLSLAIEQGQKVAIVGRTGAGKSSILSALFRLVDFQGQINFNGIDTKTMSLSKLRSSMAILTQEAFLMGDTIREILDPTNIVKDIDMYGALKAVGLSELDCHSRIITLDNILDELNLSSGERQCLCLARALLKKSKVLVLDEFTSHCDVQTAKKLNDLILSNVFANVTVLTIAHDLKSILLYDKVLVLDRGSVVEWDSPNTLLANPSHFKSMVDGEQSSG